tara:strand:- start:145 stop:507 length:363 start_codon:yes stop_codon:yes gene_type:complete
MKVTKERLSKIIKEELQKVLEGPDRAHKGGVYAQNRARNQINVGGATQGTGGYNASDIAASWENLGLGEEDARALGNEGVSVDLIKKIRQRTAEFNIDQKLALNNIKDGAAFDAALAKIK